MKKLLIVCLAAFTIMSCGSDKCEQDDWVGTYTGTLDCDGGEEEATILITAGPNDDQITFVNPDGDTETVNIDGCSFTQSEVDPTFDVDLAFVYELDGNTITLNGTGRVLGIPFNCEGSFTK